MLPAVIATRYVTPLREGGSLPGLMEADDLGTYVVKFHGAGQGRKTLVAEVVTGGLARALGLPVPDLVTVEVDPVLARGEPDQEVQDLLRASGGLNLGVDYLPGALDFDPGAFPVPAALAGRVLWFDALVGNVDRSWRNPNLLYWHGRLYLIDHGATLTFHHDWAGLAGAGGDTLAARRYDAREHVLLRAGADPAAAAAMAAAVDAADAELAPRITADLLRDVVGQVPEPWLADEPGFAGSAELREAYVGRLTARLRARDGWLPPLRDTVAGQAADPPRPAARTRGRPGWLTGKAVDR